MLTYYVWYVIIIIEREEKVMTEFKTMKKALERVYDKIEVEEWEFDNNALITVELFELTVYYWFKDGELDYVENNIDYSKITY